MKIISKWMGVVLLASSALFTTNVMAQDLKKPTLEDLIPGGETYRFAEKQMVLQWCGDDTCLELSTDSIKDICVVQWRGPKSRTRKPLLLTREKKSTKLLEQEKS